MVIENKNVKRDGNWDVRRSEIVRWDGIVKEERETRWKVEDLRIDIGKRKSMPKSIPRGGQTWWRGSGRVSFWSWEPGPDKRVCWHRPQSSSPELSPPVATESRGKLMELRNLGTNCEPFLARTADASGACCHLPSPTSDCRGKWAVPSKLRLTSWWRHLISISCSPREFLSLKTLCERPSSSSQKHDGDEAPGATLSQWRMEPTG